MIDILCIGLNPSIDVGCTTETVQPTHKVRCKNEKYYPGGGGVNVARVIAVLGGKPVLAYLSGGITGRVFDALLDDYAITKKRFEMSGSVRIAYMIQEESTQLEYKFVPEGADVDLQETASLMAFVETFDGEYFVASGSLPRGLPTDMYARIAAIAKAKGKRFILDTSGAALRAAFDFGNIYLAKPSRHEMELLIGHKLDRKGLQEVASALVAKGKVDNLVVSLGADGAMLVNADGTLYLPAIEIEVRSSVGAGDSFVGAMTWYLSNGQSIGEAFRYGVAAGSAAVMTPATELCHRKDIEALFHRLKQIEP